MPRPEPLSSATGRVSFSAGELTPRTPHSRSGRAEEAYTEIELDDVARDGVREPLLTSSWGYRSHGDDYDDTHSPVVETVRKGVHHAGLSIAMIGRRIPLVLGGLLAALLLFLTVVSYRAPEKLHEYLGVNGTNATSSGTGGKNASLDLSSPTTAEGNALLLDYGKYNYTQFPLTSTQYRHMCSEIYHGFMTFREYWGAPEKGILDTAHKDDSSVCSSSITYLLDDYVGLTADLGVLAQAAALARERNRTFFVDDTYWTRGKWTDYFKDVTEMQPGPEPGCKRPPPEELVACPRLARHWVVTARTAKYHFTHSYMDHYVNPYGIHLNRLKPLYNMALESFKTTIVPSDQMNRLIRTMRAKVSSVLKDRYPNYHEPQVHGGEPDQETSEDNPADQFGGTTYIAVHIRRGDRLAAWRYPESDDYVPIADYVSAVGDQWEKVYGDAFPQSENVTEPVVYVASDSPDALREFEERFPEGTVVSLARSGEEELVRMESTKAYVQDEFNELGEEVRVRYTKGMVVDFALLSGLWHKGVQIQPESVVCTISSNVCRLSAVGLGWDRAFGNVQQNGELDETNARWVDVDQKNRVYPVWQAFEVFFGS